MRQQEPDQKHQRKQRRRRRKRSQKKKHHNNNQVKYTGLIQGGILKGVTIFLGTTAQMTTDFRYFMKSAVAYAASKGSKHWASIIENIEKSMRNLENRPPDKNRYASKYKTKIKCEGGDTILEQWWIITNYELQAELKDNYNNKLRQKLSEKSVYCKNSKVLYNLFFGQLHSDIIAAAKNFVVPFFETVNTEKDVVGLLSILLSVCVKNLSRSKVDLHLDAL